ncbi:hypothetical protein [Pleionea sp. CnH1-48]|uniref:hypothetical protein n=1 Tax=Pleionea sp. CnH1-48 TaxID=2954494 RepID=UPI002097A46E|nr:hypothetical protein [Pleionea sp. CnH1-48]MCO7223901.1 hypothetical protein [Pleionea sp. CnH1-48]
MRTSKIALGVIALASISASSAEWSNTEIHFQYGKLKALSFAGGVEADTSIITFQHASGWKYGGNFFFVDRIDDNRPDGFNDQDWYGEWYTNLSMNKMSGRQPGEWLADWGPIMGFNFAADSSVTKYLPGIRFSWNIEGFAYLNTDFTAYIDDSEGVNDGGAPIQDDSYMIDVSFNYPFSVGEHDFQITGHAEYIGERTDELGNEVSDWILAQPQFRYDLGKALWNDAGKTFIGIEYQYWRNKLGDSAIKENTAQFLFVVQL